MNQITADQVFFTNLFLDKNMKIYKDKHTIIIMSIEDKGSPKCKGGHCPQRKRKINYYLWERQ
jgi:hypothetical protein